MARKNESEQNTPGAAVVEPQAESSAPGTATFKLDKTKEIANRFRGDYEVHYTLPAATPGVTVTEFLDNGGTISDNVVQTLRSIAERFAPEADFATVLVAKVIGQGLNLDIQKSIKDYLSDTNTAHKELSVEEALAAATAAAAEWRAGTPRAKGEGRSGKVAAAEARASTAINTALDMYRNLDGALRAQYRPMLINGGMATAEELDRVEAEAAAG